MPTVSLLQRSGSAHLVNRPDLGVRQRAQRVRHRVLAGFILVQAAFCGLTVCLALSGDGFVLLDVAIAVAALFVAFVAVAWLAQEVPTRELRKLQLLRTVDKRLLATSIGRRRLAAQEALRDESKSSRPVTEPASQSPSPARAPSISVGAAASETPTVCMVRPALAANDPAQEGGLHRAS